MWFPIKNNINQQLKKISQTISLNNLQRKRKEKRQTCQGILQLRWNKARKEGQTKSNC